MPYALSPAHTELTLAQFDALIARGHWCIDQDFDCALAPMRHEIVGCAKRISSCCGVCITYTEAFILAVDNDAMRVVKSKGRWLFTGFVVFDDTLNVVDASALEAYLPDAFTRVDYTDIEPDFFGLDCDGAPSVYL